MTLLGGALLAGLLIAALFSLFHRYLRHSLTPARERVTHLPSAYGLSGAPVRIPTRRNRWLSGWWLAGRPGSGTVIIAHGWGASRESMLPLARPLLAAGWQVLLFDMRNHGLSDSDDFSSMPRFAEDIEAALDWLRVQPGHAETPVALVGHSVGGAAALLAASRRTDIDAVVSISTFAHPADMMRRWLAWKRLPFFPVGWYVLRYVERVIGHRFDDIAPLQTLPRIRCPVLLVHGRDDPVIPAADAERLLAHRDTANVTLRLLPGGHDLSEHLEQHGAELDAFLERALGKVCTNADLPVQGMDALPHNGASH
ncbi:MAG: alpha/beta hydrolase [Halothiobacillaceae bacterium]